MPLTSKYLTLFESFAQKETFEFAPVELYEPIRYFLNLGGKRMRPVLTLMGCELFDGKLVDALPAAYAVELFHNFTLIHDDIMDHAPMRRGKPTVHEKFGSSNAVLSGDVMMIYAYEMLNRLGNEHFRQAMDLFNTTAIKVCEGQQYDLNFQSSLDVKVHEYLRMIEFKTGVLLACGLKMGALIAGAGEQDANRLFEFGRNMGISFQLMDDLLDVFGDKNKFGKKIGGDIAENKKTFLLIKALEIAKEADKERLLFYLNNNVPAEEKITQITTLFSKLGIEEETRKLIQDFHKIALENLEMIQAKKERKEVLEQYAGLLLNREI